MLFFGSLFINIIVFFFIFLEQWTTEHSDFGYDYWYQPTHDVLISSEWGAPHAFSQGFRLEDVHAGIQSLPYFLCVTYYKSFY